RVVHVLLLIAQFVQFGVVGSAQASALGPTQGSCAFLPLDFLAVVFFRPLALTPASLAVYANASSRSSASSESSSSSPIPSSLSLTSR
ncbi:hypothetical protein BE221DRAFT_69769, partial [Ostreococcus tauri]